MKRRLLSAILALMTLATLLLPAPLGMMRETEASAKLTAAQVKDKITAYTKEIGKSGKHYWNKKMSGQKLLNTAVPGKYLNCTTTDSKKAASYSNVAPSALSWNNPRECAGFAVYLEYAIFGELPNPAKPKSGKVYDGWKLKDSVGDKYTFSPGDLVRIDGHSIVVWYVENGKTVHFVECNWTDGGKYGKNVIRWDRTYSVSSLRKKVNSSGNFIWIPPLVSTPATCKVSFDLNNDLGKMTQTITVTEGKTYGTLPSPSCGETIMIGTQVYSFMGWYEAKSGGNSVTASTKVTKTSDHTLYAHWAPIGQPSTGVVTFDLNDDRGICLAETITVTEGKPYGTLPEPKRDGWTFNGWFTAEEGGTKVTASTPVTIKGNHVLYAHWTALPKPSTVGFDLNDDRGVCLAETISVTEGKPYGTLPAPTRDGWTFDGWYTAASGGTKVTASTTVTIKGDHILYAHWTAAAGAMTYAQVTAAVMQYYNTVTQNGAKKAYWNNGCSTARTKELTDANKLLQTVTSSSCSYENNTANHHTAKGSHCNLFKGIGSVNSNGVYDETAADAQCSGFAAYMEYVIFQKTTIQNTGFTKYGGSSKLPSNYAVKPGDQVRSGGHSYVIYEVDGDTAKIIQCNIPNGSCQITLSTKKVSDILKLSFDGTKTFYISSPAVKGSSGTTLATTSSIVTVTFDSQDGTVSPASKQVTVGKTYGTLPTPTLMGYVFQGWLDDKGDLVTANTTVTQVKNHTLYARWTEANIAWDAGAGEIVFNDGERDSYCIEYIKNYTDAMTFQELGFPTVERKGHVLEGWYGEDGTKIIGSTQVKPYLSTEISAKWTTAPVTPSQTPILTAPPTPTPTAKPTAVPTAAPTAKPQTNNILYFETSGLPTSSTVDVDGLSYPVANGVVALPEGVKATVVTEYTYNKVSADPHEVYPTGLKVWLVENVNGTQTAKRVADLDNILQYAGSSIRITGKKGIRMITSVPKDKKKTLIEKGIAGWTLVEYGTTVAWDSELNGESLTLNHKAAKQAYAYKKGTADPIFKDTGKLIQYTNVLVGMTNEKCVPDLALRSYMVLQNNTGAKAVIYGGTIHRNIGYIAYQNRKAFQPGTAAYAFIWEIIHFVYGNKYDADYKK